MKKYIIISAIILLSADLLQAQSFRPVYSGHFSVGILYGSNKSKFQVETIHGVRIGTWFAGIGAGIDDYYQQSIPVFVDVRKDILRFKKTPFIYAEAGTNILNKGSETNYSKAEYRSGIFYEAGIGYKINLGNKLAFNMQCGYTYKDHIENLYYKNYYVPYYYYQSVPSGQEEWVRSNHNKYTLQRLVMKIGLQF